MVRKYESAGERKAGRQYDASKRETNCGGIYGINVWVKGEQNCALKMKNNSV